MSTSPSSRERLSRASCLHRRRPLPKRCSNMERSFQPVIQKQTKGVERHLDAYQEVAISQSSNSLGVIRDSRANIFVKRSEMLLGADLLRTAIRWSKRHLATWLKFYKRNSRRSVRGETCLSSSAESFSERLVNVENPLDAGRPPESPILKPGRAIQWPTRTDSRLSTSQN